MNSLKELQKKLETECYGENALDLRKKVLCIDCKQPAMKNCYSEAGKREYLISGLCEKCFDRIFKEEK